MEYKFTRSGNVIAKDATIEGANFIVNQGRSYVGHSAVIEGTRNNGAPIISWGTFVVIDDGARIRPAERNGKYFPVIISHHVYIGKSTVVEAASIGSHVLIGDNCRIGQFAIIKDCAAVPDESIVPPYAVVGPSTQFSKDGRIIELPEAASDAIDYFCEARLQGINAEVPQF